jgi:phage repressor protein C with HTH and peptisase S24 domain
MHYMTYDDRPDAAKRLEDTREKRGFSSARDAANYFGWNYTTYVQHENGTRGVGRASAKYAKAFRVSEAWLLTGEGETPGDDINLAEVLESYQLVPEYDVQVSAGGGSLIDTEAIRSEWPFDPEYLSSELRVKAHNLSLVEVRGDSMEPTLSSGDRVMVNMADTQISQPGIFVLWDGSGTVIKRVEYVFGSDPAKLVLISDNNQHNQYEIFATDITVVGRVIWAAKRL